MIYNTLTDTYNLVYKTACKRALQRFASNTGLMEYLTRTHKENPSANIEHEANRWLAIHCLDGYFAEAELDLPILSLAAMATRLEFADAVAELVNAIVCRQNLRRN